MATTALSGVAFGAALTAAGVYHPAVITSQLKFENWHMIQAFLAAAASSGVAVLLLDRLGYYHPKPRSASRLGIFGPYDGNILGGALQGLGMALAGACPGTVIPQAAVGVPSGLYALLGTLIGGIAWSGFISPRAAQAARSAPPENPKLTVYERAGISPVALFIIFEAFCAGAVYYAGVSSPASRYAAIAPAAGGLFIGLAQLFSMLIRKTMVGVSTAYEEAGKHFFWLAEGASGSQPAAKNLLFAAGVAAGAWGLTTWDPAFKAGVNDIAVTPLYAVAGGVALAVGSRLSGGCTSGHGISGMSMFSTSSFVTIASMFGAGALLIPLFI
ncbi:hypothetical protein ACHAQA_007510 [Verticillium albo-atrum]